MNQAEDLAISKVRSGTPAVDVHRAVQKQFETAGYETGRRQGRWEGFFHGTGHGLGLEVHKPPRISATTDSRLKAAQGVTVDPGLYYSAIGSVRFEGVVLVTVNGTRSLTRFEKTLEI